MRCLTVSQIKNTATCPTNPIPRKNSKVRAAYDLFSENKGKPVIIGFDPRNPTTNQIRALQDYYGMDIRSLGKCRWMLVGEWFGKVYVDYIAERMEKAG